MKKLIIARHGMAPDAREQDDYVHDAEVVKGDFIDLIPEDEFHCSRDNLTLSAFSYEIVFKDDNLYDYWHLVGECSQLYATDELPYKAVVGLLEPYRTHILLSAVLHKHNSVYLIYRLPKALSHLMQLHLTFILESFTEGVYTYAIPESDVGTAVLPGTQTSTESGIETNHRT